MKQIQRNEMEQIQENSQKPSIKVDADVKVGGADQLHGELESVADSMNVHGFKCAHEECGLVHGHDTTKHRASDSFDMSEEEAADSEMNSVCHCGLNELARAGRIDMSPSRANSTAPIPDSATRVLESMY